MDLQKTPPIHSGGIEDKSHREKRYIHLLDMQSIPTKCQFFFRQTRILQLATLI
jgi:hypothetical protein